MLFILLLFSLLLLYLVFFIMLFFVDGKKFIVLFEFKLYLFDLLFFWLKSFLVSFMLIFILEKEEYFLCFSFLNSSIWFLYNKISLFKLVIISFFSFNKSSLFFIVVFNKEFSVLNIIISLSFLSLHITWPLHTIAPVFCFNNSYSFSFLFKINILFSKTSLTNFWLKILVYNILILCSSFLLNDSFWILLAFVISFIEYINSFILIK